MIVPPPLRVDLAGEVCWDVYYTYSHDGGRTWAERNIRVSGPLDES